MMVRQRSCAPMVGQNRISSANSGAIAAYHLKSVRDQGAQCWHSDGKDMKRREMATSGGKMNRE